MIDLSNNQEFFKTSHENKDSIMDPKIFNHSMKMEIPKVLLFINQNHDKLVNSFNNLINDIINLDNEKFKLLYLRSSDSLKEKIIENEKLFEKLILSPANTNGKNLFDLSSDNLKYKILSYPNRLRKIDGNYYLKLLKKLPNDLFEHFTKNLDYSLFFNSIDDLRYYIIGKYKISEQLADNFINKAKNNFRNIYYLLHLENNIQFIIFNKFNLVTKTFELDDNIVMSNERHINKSFFEKINEKHLIGILEKLNTINVSLSNEEILITALNLYSIFGYDNALKIINDKFTYLNNEGLERIARTCFTDMQRQYRLEHQDRFVSHQMLNQAEIAIRSNDLKFFENVFSNSDIEYINNFLTILKDDLDSANNLSLQKEIIEKHLRKEIKNRENEFRKNFVKDYVLNYKVKNPDKRKSINSEELYQIFKDIDISNITLDNKGRPILDNDLISFLLGNLKTNNDCLLRLILNKQAIGLNDNINLIINNFDKIKAIISQSQKKLSINSILDVIDITKVLLYNLAPNEQDLTLATIAKILKSQQYCNESKEIILDRSKSLHHRRKFKISSSIPIIQSSKKDGIKYKTLPFDDPALITCGIDTQSCLRISGKGEDFLEYCMTNKHSMIIGLWDEDNNFYICPFIRNGNTVYGNGIDPKPANDYISNQLLEALKEAANKIIENSYNEEKIDIVTLTDLNNRDFFVNKGLKQIPINGYIPINGEFYSDYHKKEINNYILSSNKNKKATNYIPNSSYYQARTSDYIYNVVNENDKERINIIINSIYYDSINFKKISEETKLNLKRSFQNLDVDNYIYIIGNKDWFIAVDEQTNILSCCLPYDPRAKMDYLNALANVKNNDFLNERKYSK